MITQEKVVLFLLRFHKKKLPIIIVMYQKRITALLIHHYFFSFYPTLLLSKPDIRPLILFCLNSQDPASYFYLSGYKFRDIERFHKGLIETGIFLRQQEGLANFAVFIDISNIWACI